jgi:hypothetical protein
MVATFSIAMVRGETEVWGDGLPWIGTFWLGFLILCGGLITVWQAGKKST